MEGTASLLLHIEMAFSAVDTGRILKNVHERLYVMAASAIVIIVGICVDVDNKVRRKTKMDATVVNISDGAALLILSLHTTDDSLLYARRRRCNWNEGRGGGMRRIPSLKLLYLLLCGIMTWDPTFLPPPLYCC